MNHLKTYENFSKVASSYATGVTPDQRKNQMEINPRLLYNSVHLNPDYLEFRRIATNIENGTEPNISEILRLNSISEYENFYQITKKWVEDKFRIFKKYSYEDMEDRLLEFFDEIPNFNPKIMFSISKGGSSIGINFNKLNDPKYLLNTIGGILNDILYNCIKSYDVISINQYFDTNKCAISIYLNGIQHFGTGSYNLIFLESLVDKIVKRFSQLYDVSHITYDFERAKRQYDPNHDVQEYDFRIYLN